MFRYHHGPVAGHDWWFGLIGFIFWVVVIGGIAWLLVHHHNHCQPMDRDHRAAKQSSEPTDPLDIAKSRYAHGEITAEEFQKIKTDLS